MASALTFAWTTAAVAQPGWGHGVEHGWGPGPWWPIFPLLWVLLWAALIITAIVLWRRRSHGDPTRSAQAVLAEEFARGNITEDEYQQRLSVLRRKDG